MKIKAIVCLLLLVISISAPSASALTTDEILNLVYQKLAVYPVDDSGWIQTIDHPNEVQPGASLNVIAAIKNPATLPDQSYKIKLQLVDGTGTILDETAPFDLSSGNTASKTLTTLAPRALGSYQYQVLRSVWDSYAGTWMIPTGPEPFTVTVTPMAPSPTPADLEISDPINQPPNAVITWQSDPTGTVRVSGRTSTDPDDRVVKYHFYVDGEQYASAAYTDIVGEPGDIIEVCLVVTDTNGATDDATITLAFSGTPSGDVSVHEVSNQYTSPVETGDQPPIKTGDKPPIYFEDGALKVPGFGLLFALVAVLCLAAFRSKK